MKPLTHMKLVTPAAALTSVAVALALTAKAGTIYFEADFDATTVTEVTPGSGRYLAQITKANLDAGTAVGDWTVLQAQGIEDNTATKSIQGEGAANVTNKALRFGIAIDGSTGSSNPVLTANLTGTVAVSDQAPITVAFDYADGTPDQNNRTFWITGVDGSDRDLFRLALKSNGGGLRQLAYWDGTTDVLIGAQNDLNSTGSSPNGANADYDPSLLKPVEIVIDSDSFDVLLEGVLLAGADDLPFLDGSADGLAKIEFATGTRWTGGWFDNLTVSSAIAPAGFPLTIAPSASTPGSYDFAWDSQDGKLYDLVSSTDLATAPETWPVWEGNADLAGTAPTNTLTAVAPGPDPNRFFAVIEKDPPPLLEEDFESGNGGFTMVDNTAGETGTDWAWGAPTSTDDGGTPNPGGSVTTGNDGSTNCWGTGIGNPGYYANPTDTCLRSAVIDLTGVAAAELTFAQALDLEAGDSVTVNIIDDTTDTAIATDIVTITDGDLSTANWESVGPVAIPSGALGQPVRIEWCLSGTGGTSFDFMGWYIDDVVVEDTSP